MKQTFMFTVCIFVTLADVLIWLVASKCTLPCLLEFQPEKLTYALAQRLHTHCIRFVTVTLAIHTLNIYTLTVLNTLFYLAEI